MANCVFQLALFRTYAKRDFASISGRLANAAANQIDELKMAYDRPETGRDDLSISHVAAEYVYLLSLDKYFVRDEGRVLLKYASCPSCFYWQIKRVPSPSGPTLQATMDPYCLQDRISRIVSVRWRMLACRRLCVIFRFNFNAIKFPINYLGVNVRFLDTISSRATEFRDDFQVDSNEFIYLLLMLLLPKFFITKKCHW